MSPAHTGPKLLGQLLPLVIGASSVQVLGPNSRRVGLLISSTSATIITVSFGAAVVPGQGINIPAGTQPLRLSYAEVGELIREPVFAVAGGAGSAFSVLEVSLP